MELEDQTLVLSNGRETRRFVVDQVFDSRAGGSQAAVFESFGKGLVEQSLQGYNICVFAYGHTGSGKTYTIFGDGTELRESSGLLPRFLHAVFCVRSERRWRCEFFEVYNEQIRDLLCPTERARKVHVHPKYGVRIEQLATSLVGSAEEALSLVAFGNQLRAVAATTMNTRSSRSHAVFTFKYEPEDADCHSTVTFVDLAGREDGSAAQHSCQARERQHINTSLFHLAHLIQKLEKAEKGPGLADFRNSKLTLLLSQALSGNSRTALLATVAPLQRSYEDSLATLSFAASVKRLRTKPVVNGGSRCIVEALEAEVRRLQLELERHSDQELRRELLAAQSLVQHYRRSWEELRAESEELRRFHQEAMLRYGEHNGPFLTKLCDDPALQGCCNLFLRAEGSRIGGDESCDIVLRGLGIGPQMCVVRLVDGEAEVEPAALARVLVNGEPLTGSRRLQHGDSLLLGYAHGFRLVVPQGTDALASARRLQLDAAAARPELKASTARRQLQPLVDEANLITEELQEELCFAIQSLADSHQLLVSVGPASDRTQQLWPLPKFLGRLREMRELYQEAEEHGFAQVRRVLEEPWRNPWRELSFAEVRSLKRPKDAESSTTASRLSDRLSEPRASPRAVLLSRCPGSSPSSQGSFSPRAFEAGRDLYQAMQRAMACLSERDAIISRLESQLAMLPTFQAWAALTSRACQREHCLEARARQVAAAGRQKLSETFSGWARHTARATRQHASLARRRLLDKATTLLMLSHAKQCLGKAVQAWRAATLERRADESSHRRVAETCKTASVTRIRASQLLQRSQQTRLLMTCFSTWLRAHAAASDRGVSARHDAVDALRKPLELSQKAFCRKAEKQSRRRDGDHLSALVDNTFKELAGKLRPRTFGSASTGRLPVFAA